MTKDSARQAFEEMEVEKLLATAAFFADEYTVDGLKVLKSVAAERGITEEAIRYHRSRSYPGIAFSFKCDSCMCDLELSREEFIDGKWTCPNCNASGLVHFFYLVVPPSVIDRLTGVFFTGGILGEMRDSKHAAQRKAIEDGSYWEELRGIKRRMPQ